MATKIHSYKGAEIERCEGGHNKGRWIVALSHKASGLALSDELCHHFYTLAAARQGIDAMVAAERRYGAGEDAYFAR